MLNLANGWDVDPELGSGVYPRDRMLCNMEAFPCDSFLLSTTAISYCYSDFDHSEIGLASTNPSASRHPGLSRSSYLPACATGLGISTRSYLFELQPCNFVSHDNINTLH